MRSFASRAVTRAAWCAVLAAAVAVAGCSSLASAVGFNQATSIGQCGSPPPVPVPFLFLANPANGATNVPTTVGRLVFSGFFAGSSSIQLTAGSSNSVQAGALAPAASPLPSPLATPPGSSGQQQYFAASVPALAPSTTYTVVHSYPAWSSTPPCTQISTATLGSFTTQ